MTKARDEADKLCREINDRLEKGEEIRNILNADNEPAPELVYDGMRKRFDVIEPLTIFEQGAWGVLDAYNFWLGGSHSA